MFFFSSSDFPFSKLKAEGKTVWNGVHNHQAQNFLKSMKCGDQAFYYHTEKEKAIVGIAKIVKEFYHNEDPKFGEVDVGYDRPLKNPVTLKMLKESTNEHLQSLTILKQPRLSVSSVTPDQWDAILELSNQEE